VLDLRLQKHLHVVVGELLCSSSSTPAGARKVWARKTLTPVFEHAPSRRMQLREFDLIKAVGVLFTKMHSITRGLLHDCFVVMGGCMGNRQRRSSVPS